MDEFAIDLDKVLDEFEETEGIVPTHIMSLVSVFINCVSCTLGIFVYKSTYRVLETLELISF